MFSKYINGLIARKTPFFSWNKIIIIIILVDL